MKNIICIGCGLSKPPKDFYFRQDTKKHRTECRACYSNNNRMRKHGVPAKDYKSMLDEQDSVCAIYHERPEEILSVDHDNTTGAIRGLLCQRCNKGLGLFQDSLDNLHNAVAYMEKASKL